MAKRERHRLEIAGAVQGVGFRPFAHRLAVELDLAGWAMNSLQGVDIEIEGDAVTCADFVRQVRESPPPNAVVRHISVTRLPVEGTTGFEIRQSEIRAGEGATEMLPDLATCPDCIREIFDPGNRRYHYPFTNCTRCGPRFSIVRALPWDRERTTMDPFEMCPACREEFESPGDRRFHAQPNACPDCGPQFAFADAAGRTVAYGGEALENAARAIEAGRIIALKGIGGFQLIADARSEAVIGRLRERKNRPAKPFALMLADLGAVRAHCRVSDLEASVLASPRAPIVILRRLPGNSLPDRLAPGNPGLGVMLPYSPLHHLLLRRLGFPVVATSGNVSGEPLCIDNGEALQRLQGIADGFLVHDRAIARPIDDSVVRIAMGRELILRAARGYTPFSVGRPGESVVAIGGDEKAAIAVTGPFGIRCGPHIGDLETEAAQQVWSKQIEDLPGLCGVDVKVVACDLHPGYHGTRMAADLGRPVVRVQHHHAHIAACLAEHDIEEEVLGVAWDGTGFGLDGQIWGGEFLLATKANFRRVAHLRPFPLPGGELSIRQPRYAALGLLEEAGIPVEETGLAAHFTAEELAVARTQIARGLNAPLTSSAGRLFEAVAALLGIRYRNRFEAQAAMELEFAAERAAGGSGTESWPIPRREDGAMDWEPMIRSLLSERESGADSDGLAARFVESLARMITEVARMEKREVVVLGGGCFQNILLLETTVAKLRSEGFIPTWPHQAPPNDGGLALGQAAIALARLGGGASDPTHVLGDSRKTD